MNQHPPTSRAPVPLAMHHTPFCLTFAYYPSPPSPSPPTPICLLDPTALEQRLAHGTLSLALTPTRELCVAHKAGGLPLAVPDILRAVDVACARAKALEALVEARLAEDWAGRRVEVR